MNISVLSGKGGTGKTTISTNLAIALSNQGYKTQYLDFDVEEPNGFIFLKPFVISGEKVYVQVPQVNEELCNNCGLCGESCNFNAIVALKDKVTIFEKLCHSCGVCTLVCPQKAISEKDREVGFIEKGSRVELSAIRGVLNIGEPMGIPILRKLKEYLKEEYINIIDSPPGSSCSVINSVEDSDYAILVTEPTSFGLHDLDIAANVVSKMNINFGVVINKSNENDSIIEEYCRNKNIDIIGKITFDRRIAQEYSKGKLLIGNDEIDRVFDTITSKIMEEV